MSKNIEYGDVEISDDELKIENAKVRINAWIDGDVIQELRKVAKKNKTGYQTLMNEVLRSAVLGDCPNPIMAETLTKRVEDLEEKILKILG